MNKELKEVVSKFSEARNRFEMEVEASALEVIEIAKQISSAIGEVSIDEVKNVIIREFTERLMTPRAYGEFQGKK